MIYFKITQNYDLTNLNFHFNINCSTKFRGIEGVWVSAYTPPLSPHDHVLLACTTLPQSFLSRFSKPGASAKLFATLLDRTSRKLSSFLAHPRPRIPPNCIPNPVKSPPFCFRQVPFHKAKAEDGPYFTK